MARPKGSKNKARTVKASVDYAAVVAEKTAKTGSIARSLEISISEEIYKRLEEELM